jgi:hypothetical protein
MAKNCKSIWVFLNQDMYQHTQLLLDVYLTQDVFRMRLLNTDQCALAGVRVKILVCM